MEFTYKAYKELLDNLIEHGYQITDYHDHDSYEKSVILRHDVDYSLEAAVHMANMEKNYGVKSTYFILLSSDFYNIASQKGKNIVREIYAFGHEIGLHFDETLYMESDDLTVCIRKEAEIMREIFGIPIRTVSMHRPSDKTLQRELYIPGMVNSYGNVFFNEFKYLSDSRRCWREDVRDIITQEKFQRLHILTHAFWYKEVEEFLEVTVANFVNRANYERYGNLDRNIRDLNSIMKENEIIGWKQVNARK